jgi:DnaJ-class molecular chaperone
VESNNLKNHLADLNLATKLPTRENLDRGFRSVAMKFHPDKCKGEEDECGDKFKQLNNSKATLQGACFNSR